MARGRKERSDAARWSGATKDMARGRKERSDAARWSGATARFANILFSGPCNLRCPDCIGRRLVPRPDNLDRFPLAGLDRFCGLLRRLGVTQVTLTGTNTDPQLYRHEAALIAALRARVPGARLNLHTNGVLALRRIETFNRYDRACISLPSFEPDTCRRMTGSARVLPLARILAAARIPVKISTLVTEHNVAEVPSIVARCRALGIRRMALRRRHGDPRRYPLLAGHRPVRRFAGNPVFDVDGIEVTVWDFGATTLDCLNLLSDGTISGAYLLERAS